MIHAACGYTEFHPMKLCIQGTNSGTISELYTRYSFSAGTKYEEGRHQICVEDEKNMEFSEELPMLNWSVTTTW